MKSTYYIIIPGPKSKEITDNFFLPGNQRKKKKKKIQGVFKKNKKNKKNPGIRNSTVGIPHLSFFVCIHWFAMPVDAANNYLLISAQIFN